MCETSSHAPEGSLSSPSFWVVLGSAAMKLDIHNLTDRSLLCHWDLKSPEHHILLPNQPTNVKTPNCGSSMTLTAHQSMGQRGQKDEIWLSTTSFSFRRRSRALWAVMEVDESAPWVIYRCRVSCSPMTCATTSYEITLFRFPGGTKNCSFSPRGIHFRFCLDCPTLHLCHRFAFRVSPIPPRGLPFPC